MPSSTSTAHAYAGAADSPQLETHQVSATETGAVRQPGDGSQDRPRSGGLGEAQGTSAGASGTHPTANSSAQSSTAPCDTSDAPPNTAAVDARSDKAKAGSIHYPNMDKEAFTLLVQRANAGDEQALQELRMVLDRSPEIWRQIGDLASHAELATLRLVGGDDRLLMEALKRKVDELKAELTRPGASTLEQLVVLRVVATWLQVQHADTASASSDQSVQQGKFWALKQDQAHRRHLTAIKDLARLQQMLPVNSQNVPESEATADGVKRAAEPAESDAASRHGGGQREPQTDEQGDGPYPRPIVPFGDAAGEDREVASG